MISQFRRKAAIVYLIAAVLVTSPGAFAGPDGPSETDVVYETITIDLGFISIPIQVLVSGSASFKGNQSNGVLSGVDFTTPPITTVWVSDLTTNITPVTGTSGVRLHHTAGNGANGSSGLFEDSDDPGDPGGVGLDLEVRTFDPNGFVVSTNGVQASGVSVISQGGRGGNGEDNDGVFSNTGGRGGSGGAGGDVSVENGFAIGARGNSSHGILAVSAAGNGGTGGDGSGFVGSGGAGGAGGVGGAVTVSSSNTVQTDGAQAHGILASSRGGAGGNGGSGSGFFTDRGAGAGSGGGGAVDVSASGLVLASGTDSHGIFAQSIGGFAGSAGGASGLVNYGANAGSAGDGGAVTVETSGTVFTSQSRSHGIFGQSVGGGGGSAGTGAGLLNLGGSASSGGDGGAVAVTNDGFMYTAGASSRGVFAQSVGGGGGDGSSTTTLVDLGGTSASGGNGGSVTVSNSGSGSIFTQAVNSDAIFAQSVGGGGGSAGDSATALSLGGSHSGAGGGGSGTVTVANDGVVSTSGDRSRGIFAQSVGGGGGDGGDSFLGLSLGGKAGGGGDGAAVMVNNNGTVQTAGSDSQAIFAQSVGGGGGNAGSSVGRMSVGASGGAGGDGAAVTVENRGDVSTFKSDSTAIFAQSVGGGGGKGGGSVGVNAFAGLAVGGSGGGGGDGAEVLVGHRAGSISTSGDRSHGIFAQSVGGGGGTGGQAVALSAGIHGSVSVAAGGAGGDGGSASSVEVQSAASITTRGADSHGIQAQSVGGGGGNAGFAVSAAASTGLGASAALGGAGGKGGGGQQVIVSSHGAIETQKDRSIGIFAQSVGGGGGNGGFSIAVAGGAVAGGSLSMGGSGGDGGSASQVQVTTSGDITTGGATAHGVLAQSVGGGGGNGGFSIAAAGGRSAAVALSLGGSGGGGGDGSAVDLTLLAGQVKTVGSGAVGAFAQSVGGGGGSGGFSISGSGAQNGAASISLGGSGGDGGNGYTVNPDGTQSVVKVANAASIVTEGEFAHGLQAQSIGGGGGNGGLSVSGTLGVGAGSKNLSVSIGGSGGAGGHGGIVDVMNQGDITTKTLEQGGTGILAQSIGGGGGNGGASFAGAFAGNDAKSVSIAVGGGGGVGGKGQAVTVAAARNPTSGAGDIETFGVKAHGIHAQSIGGGGGNGGLSVALAAGQASVEGSNHNIAASVGGAGGSGNTGGAVRVTTSVDITTHGANSHGVLAQSVGGGGGDGGSSWAVTLTRKQSAPTDPNAPPVSKLTKAKKAVVKKAVGGARRLVTIRDQQSGAFSGDGGSGNVGGSVEVRNIRDASSLTDGTIETFGNGSSGIFAQSVGGGGGTAGSARALKFKADGGGAVSILNQLLLDGETVSNPVTTSRYEVGGAGGSGGHGGNVNVVNTGRIITHGAESQAIFAQSVGGGGGVAGDTAHGILDVSELVAGLTDQATALVTPGPLDRLDIDNGGFGSNGNGGFVGVDNKGDLTTAGDGSVGIFAQSVGGGGGVAGSGEQGATGSVSVGGTAGASGDGGYVQVLHDGAIDTSGKAAHGIFAQSVGGGGGLAGNIDGGIAFAGALPPGAHGGGSGTGGVVEVDSKGTIHTRGSGAIGIFAQSVGGGGGVAGDLNSGFGTAGTAGGAGWGNAVFVKHVGDITTEGDGAIGIFAQSAGGTGGWFVDVTLDGNLSVLGANASGILVQSTGGQRSNMSVLIEDGAAVSGGSGGGAGVFMIDGFNNTLTNKGSLSALSGYAIFAGIGNETVLNHGLIQGNVNLGDGLNEFQNLGGSVFETGDFALLGGGDLLNDGLLSLGGAGMAQTTLLGGDLLQGPTGVLDFEFGGFGLGDSDFLDIWGSATLLEGGISLSFLDGYDPFADFAVGDTRSQQFLGSWDLDWSPATVQFNFGSLYSDFDFFVYEENNGLFLSTFRGAVSPAGTGGTEPVPEPGTLVLMGAAVALALGRSWRNKRKAARAVG